MSADINQDQLDSLMEQHMGLVVTLANSFKPQNENQLDEYIQLGRIGLWKALTKYDPKKAKLSTWVWQYIRWEILRYLQQEKKQCQALPLNEATCTPSNVSIEMREYIPNSLNTAELDVISLRVEGHTFTDIGKKLGYSRVWANNTYRSAEQKIKDANQKHDDGWTPSPSCNT